MTARQRTVALTPSAGVVRASVGPYAWVVLEALAEQADVVGDEVVAEGSVRDVARCTGLSKDTVARAVSRLIDAGIIDRSLGRDMASGRFGRSVCVLHLDRAGLDLIDASPTTSDTAIVSLATTKVDTSRQVRTARQARAPRTVTCEGQLSFLDDTGTVA